MARRAARADQHVSWFDASMLYVRVTNCQQPLVGIPESLLMRFPPREIGVCVEVNGARISPSEEVSLVLRCSRLAKQTAASDHHPPDAPLSATSGFMYVSTDSLRTSATLQFEIVEVHAPVTTLVASGSLVKNLAGSRFSTPQWVVASTCEIGPDGCAFVKGKLKHAIMGGISISVATMEICAVGKFMGEPMILTQTLLLKRRHSSSSSATLNAILEDKPAHTSNGLITSTLSSSIDFFNEAGEVPMFFDMARSGTHVDPTSAPLAKSSADFLVKAQQLSKFDSSSSTSNLDMDQEENWYKRGISTGIKVGLGIGVGMCIGVGIGLGLIIHKFRTTTTALKRISL